MARHLQTIAIIGGGFSGIVLAANLLRHPPRHALRVMLLEREARLGGPAYAARDYPYLLNVPAGRMSADPGAPDAFLQFARRRAPAVNAHDFVPRSWYGDYLRELLAEADCRTPPRVALERLREEVVGVARSGKPRGTRLQLKSGRVLLADQVVFACGNPPAAQLSGLAALRDHPRYAHDACDDRRRQAMHGEVLLIGTGLTMADVALASTARGAARVVAISRHGLLPPGQTDSAHRSTDAEAISRLATARSVRAMLRVARSSALATDASGGDWRCVVNAIREHAPAIWQALDDTERRRFLRHLRPYWDAHRHRLPPGTFERLRALRGSGHLQVHAGRILEAQPDDGRLRVTWRPRGELASKRLTVDWIVNCTGPDYNLHHSPQPLFRSAIEAGLLVPDDSGLGLRTGGNGALLDAQGEESRALYCLGPMLRADHWETTAVAELRLHAESLAAHLAGHEPVALPRLHVGHMSTGKVDAVNRHFRPDSRNASLLARRQAV